ncbi:SgrR family transcriptional regulator [Vibrio cholerae]|nr:SgrR family transcriptional regulator [Vibrio cholerae]
MLDQDAAKLTQVIESYLGVQHQEGLQVVSELTHLTLGRSMCICKSPIPAYRYCLPKPVPKSSQRSPIAIPILI